MKKVYFIVYSEIFGSAILRGYQISRQLQKEGVRVKVINLRLNIKEAAEELVRIKDSIVIFVKKIIQEDNYFIVTLKKNKNILIWDIIDLIVQQCQPVSAQCFLDKQRKNFSVFDGAIFPNDKCRRDWRGYFKKSCITQVLFHHWDPRLKPNHAKKFSLAYVGGPENLNQKYLKNIPGLCLISWNTALFSEQLLKKILNYNCHFAIRKEGTDGFNYKSNVKLSCAAATNSNIILSRDHSFIELLDSSYPYYTNSCLKNVKNTVKFVQETYGSKIWHYALNMIDEVRNRTSIKRISKDYIQYLKHF